MTLMMGDATRRECCLSRFRTMREVDETGHESRHGRLIYRIGKPDGSISGDGLHLRC